MFDGICDNDPPGPDQDARQVSTTLIFDEL